MKLWAIVCVLVAGGCAADSGGGGSRLDGGPPADASPEPELEWARCEVVLSGETGDEECATIEVPIDRASGAASPMLPLRLKRLRARARPARGQLWLVQGGPGGSAWEDFAGLRRGLEDELVDLDFYAIDHRGTGGASRLTCPSEEDPSSEGGAAIVDAEWEACTAHLRARWGAGLDGFTTSASALDLDAAITRVRGAEDEVYVWGISYGTRQVSRLLALGDVGSMA